MTARLEISCNNCSQILSVVYKYDAIDDDVVCLNCFNELLVQLGMDKL